MNARRDTLLIVEDDPGWRKTIANRVTELGRPLKFANTLEEGRRQLENPRIAAVILDLLLDNDNTSLELAKTWIDRLGPETLLILTSNRTDPRFDRQIRQLRAVHVFDKDVFSDHPGAFLQTLKEALDASDRMTMLEEWRELVRRSIRKFRDSYAILNNISNTGKQLSLEDEYDVQRLLAAVLAPHFEHVYLEEPTRRIGHNAHRLDIVIRDIGTVIETKVLRQRGDLRKVSQQLKEDIEGYCLAKCCSYLLGFVFDLSGCITAADRAKFSDLNGRHGHNGVCVDVEIIAI